MERRIIGQCNTNDFIHLEHLSEWMAQGREVDLSNLTNRQKVAVRVLAHFQRNGESIELCRKLREVKLWDMGSGGAAFEYVLLDKRDRVTRDKLRAMR